MNLRFDEFADDLRAAYGGGAEWRDSLPKTAWKLAERAAFRDRLLASGARTLVEIGAGTGQDALYFQDNGLAVVATGRRPAGGAGISADAAAPDVVDVRQVDADGRPFHALTLRRRS